VYEETLTGRHNDANINTAVAGNGRSNSKSGLGREGETYETK